MGVVYVHFDLILKTRKGEVRTNRQPLHTSILTATVHITWNSVRLALRSGFWPGDGQKECTLFERFHVVLETTREC